MLSWRSSVDKVSKVNVALFRKHPHQMQPCVLPFFEHVIT